MSKHTPGPWYLQGSYVVHGPPDGPEKWRTTRVVKVRAGQSYREVETDQANALLIAAAPELLEALEDWYDMMSKSVEDPSGAFDELANEFYRDTGWMAPGKDSPHDEGDYSKRLAAWREWLKRTMAARVERTRVAIAKAKGNK